MFFAQHQQHIDCFQMHALIWVIELVKMLSSLASACGRDAIGNLKEENNKN